MPQPFELSHPPRGPIEIERFGHGDDSAPSMLLEVPHGASTAADFAAIRRRLRGPLPDDLEAFFFVNTDFGALDVARAVARLVAAAGGSATLLASRLPRTLADCNRLLSHRPTALGPSGLTPSVPSYVDDEADRRLLESLHREYQQLAHRAYRRVCGAGGLALAVHTYAPRSVTLERIDERVVDRLRDAYRPRRYRSWPLRPEIELITETPEGEPLAPAALVARLRQELRRAAFQVAENTTYRLVPGTLGTALSRRFPGRVATIEIRRDLLASPWVPFAPSEPDPAKVERVAGALAAALDAEHSASVASSRRG